MVGGLALPLNTEETKKICPPSVEYSEFEIEFRGSYDVGSNDAGDGKLEKEIGLNAGESTEVETAWSTRYRMQRRFEPGVELHSEFGGLANMMPYREQEYLLGPVFYGKLGKIKYDIGYLFGISSAAPDGVLKWIIEHEFYF